MVYSQTKPNLARKRSQLIQSPFTILDGTVSLVSWSCHDLSSRRFEHLYGIVSLVEELQSFRSESTPSYELEPDDGR